MSPGFLKMIDEWRRAEPDIPPRAEAIRRLVHRGYFSKAWQNLAHLMLDEWCKVADQAGVSPEVKGKFYSKFSGLQSDEEMLPFRIKMIDDSSDADGEEEIQPERRR